MNKKGMEMWMLVFMILALVLLVLLVAWYSGLNTQIQAFLDRMLGWL